MSSELKTNLTNAYRLNDQRIQANSRTFHFATSLLAGPQRQAIRSLYAFCRVSDDLVDRGLASAQDLEHWRAQARLEPEAQTDPILLAWSHTRREFKIDLLYQEELLDGISMDLSPQRFKDWPSLERYCYLVASTVGLLSTPILGLSPGVTFAEAAPSAIQLGIALQLTNILRDVGEDAARGRVYLPISDLERFNLSEADILDGVMDQRFVDLMCFEIDRARAIYRQALPGIGTLSPEGRLAVGAAALLYRAILNEIEAIQYQVYRLRAHTSGLKKLTMLPHIAFTVLTL